MFIRLVTDQIDNDRGLPVGVFTVAYRLLDDAEVPDFQRNEIRATLDWFRANLPIPDRFSRSRQPGRDDKGICWFKADATDCMTHLRYLAYLVSEHDVMIRELTTNSPGYAIYEDDFQVVAEPFASTPR